MRKILVLALAIGLSVLSMTPANSATKITNYFVSTSGNDSNSGALQAPFKTIQKCARAAGVNAICNIRAGNYYETVTPNSGTTFQSYQNERAVVFGTQTIGGFQPYKANQYVASVSMRTDDTNQIFFNSNEGVNAKWPNGGDAFHPNWAHLQSGTSTTVLKDSNLPSEIAGNGNIKFWSGNDAWSAQTAEFSNSTKGSLQVSLDGNHQDQQITPKEGGLYYLFNNLAFLDSDFEWFYDQVAKKLYVQIPKRKSITDYKIQYKVRDLAFNLTARHNVTIKNLGIFASTIRSDSRSHDNVIDGLNAKFISSVTRIRDDKVNHPWDGGFDFDHNFDTGIMVKGSHNVLRNSIIDQSSCNGVLVTGSYNSITNNLISNVDSMFNNCSGVYIVGSHQTISHNTIYNTGRSAIFPTLVWHPIDNPNSDAPSFVDISYNDLFGTALLGNDIGAIYMGSGVFTGMKIHHNWIHDSHFPTVRPATPWPLNNISGVYIDENSAGVEVYQNILWNLDFRSIFINGANRTDHPNDNLIHNNSIPDSAQYAEIHLGGPITTCGSTRVFDNRVLVDVRQEAGSNCKIENNSSTAAGATEMEAVTPGCTLNQCVVDPFKPNHW